jgi:hypothetical protein
MIKITRKILELSIKGGGGADEGDASLEEGGDGS